MLFGLNSAPSCFYKIMSTILAGVPGIAIYLDDECPESSYLRTALKGYFCSTQSPIWHLKWRNTYLRYQRLTLLAFMFQPSFFRQYWGYTSGADAIVRRTSCTVSEDDNILYVFSTPVLHNYKPSPPAAQKGFSMDLVFSLFWCGVHT